MKVNHLLYIAVWCLVCAQVNAAPSPTTGSYSNYTTRTTIPWWMTSRPTTPSYQNCYISSNTCLNGGSCTYSSSYYGYYRCVCRYGYTGKRCETTVKTTTTVSPTVITNIGIGIQCGNKVCYNNATCYRFSYGSSTRCDCGANFTGTYCEKPKCTTTNPCLNGGRCSYGRCYCKNNYFYTGYLCEKVSECNPHNYSLRCQNNGYCKVGKCECTLAYDGAFCERYRKCSTNHTCLNGGTCYKGVCYCPPGFSGRFCDIIVMTTTSPLCQCKFGNCLPDPKHNYLPRCSCFNGYTGRNCETELPDLIGGGKWCNPINPCHNGAKCIGDDFDYDCKCDPKKYYGSHCEREYVTCNYGSSCQNGGTCRRYRYGSILKYNYRGLCVCKTGYKGDFCQKEIDAYPHWVEIFSENQRWSGNYSYNKFMITFQLEIDAVTKDELMATLSDQDTKIVMKGYSIDDIYITFNMSRLIKPSHRIPSDFELSGQFIKRSKKKIWEFKGKVSRPDNAIFGTFTLSPTKDKAERESQKQVAIAIGVGTSVSVLFVVAVVIVVILLVRKGVLRREPRAFSPTRFSNSEQSINTVGK